MHQRDEDIKQMDREKERDDMYSLTERERERESGLKKERIQKRIHSRHSQWHNEGLQLTVSRA